MKTASLKFQAPESCAKCMLSTSSECHATLKKENIDRYVSARSPNCPLEVTESASVSAQSYRYAVEYQNSETCFDICYREFNDESEAKKFEGYKLNNGAKQVKFVDRNIA